LDRQFVDVLGLVDDDLLILQRLVEGEELLALDLVLAVQEEDGQVVVRVRAGDLVVGDSRGGRPGRRAGREGESGGGGQRQQAGQVDARIRGHGSFPPNIWLSKGRAIPAEKPTPRL